MKGNNCSCSFSLLNYVKWHQASLNNYENILIKILISKSMQKSLVNM